MAINRYAGESLIWGIDYYHFFNDETELTFWCQYEDDDYRLSLDQFGKIDLGLPRESYELTKNPSGFNKFIGKSEYGERQITFSTYLKKENDVSIISRRRDFLIDYFTSKENRKLYFYLHKKHFMKSYRVEVKPQISGEKYSNFSFSPDISISLLCKSVFFEAVEWSEVSKIVNNTKKHEIEVLNTGFETSFILKIVPNKDLVQFQLQHESLNAFRVKAIDRFYSGRAIEVDTGTGEIRIDGVIQDLSFARGATFNLRQGSQTLFFEGDDSLVSVKYKEKIK